MKRRILCALLATSLTASAMLSGCSEAPTPTITPAITTSPATEPSTTSPPETTPSVETTAPPTTAPIIIDPTETTVPVPNDTENLTSLDLQLNSLNMLNYLAVIAEEIRVSKDNRLFLEEIYSELENNLNPGVINQITQDYLRDLRNTIGNLQMLETKRKRILYIYNQDKADAIRSAVPDPLSILSMSGAINWRTLALSTVYTVVDSYNNYQTAPDSADRQYLTSGWELDDVETDLILNLRSNAVDYMIDITQECTDPDTREKFGKLTLTIDSVTKLSEYLSIDNARDRIDALRSAEGAYFLLGDYWLALADSYFEIEEYADCLACVEKYYSLDNDIFRIDTSLAAILPKAIVAAQQICDDSDYITRALSFTEDLVKNTAEYEWSAKYFAAQVYLDLYSKTDIVDYLTTAYNLIYNNVSQLISTQKEMNSAYIQPVKTVSTEKSDYEYLTDKEYKAEKKRIQAYNDTLKLTRKTELPSLFEPFILNCDLLIALAEKIGVDEAERARINNKLNDAFLTMPIRDHYSFDLNSPDYSMTFTKEEMIIPVTLLAQGATFIVTVTTDGSEPTVFSDWKVTEVVREDSDDISSFFAHIASEKLSNYKWSLGAEILVQISNGDNYSPIDFHFVVAEYDDNGWLADTVIFEAV